MVPGSCEKTDIDMSFDCGGGTVTVPDGTEVNVDGGSTVSGGTVTDPDGEEILPEPDYVPPSRPTYRPEVGETDSGTVKVAPSYPHKGDTVTVTPMPNEGQEVRDVVVTDKDGELVEVTPNEDGTYTFVQPAGRVAIEATFGCDVGELCATHGYPDLDHSQWYHDAVDWAEEAARRGAERVYLTVNKNNARAIRAYEKFGFLREGEECTAIGEGYYMDDYIYSYRLQK